MESKLETVKKLMELEGQKRSSQGMKGGPGQAASGSMWRSTASAQKGGIRSYADNVEKQINE
jgi:hypothetical protein